ncbi:unnamed protein product, partial [Leptidea sinapis]
MYKSVDRENEMGNEFYDQSILKSQYDQKRDNIFTTVVPPPDLYKIHNKQPHYSKTCGSLSNKNIPDTLLDVKSKSSTLSPYYDTANTPSKSHMENLSETSEHTDKGEYSSDDIFIQSTDAIQALLNAIKEKSIEMMAEQMITDRSLITTSATEVAFNVWSQLSATERNKNKYSTGTTKTYIILPTHYVKARSITSDTVKIAQNVENVLQSKLKKAYSKFLKKLSGDLKKEINSTKSTIISKLNNSSKENKVSKTPPPLKHNPIKLNKKNCSQKIVQPNKITIVANKPLSNKSTSKAHTIPIIGDDYSMLSVYEQILAKSLETNSFSMMTSPKFNILDDDDSENKKILSKRNLEGQKELPLTNIKVLSNNAYIMPDMIDVKERDLFSKISASTTDNNKHYTYDTSEDTSFDGLSNKICYKDYVNGYKYYLKFLRNQEDNKFSNQVRYQAHRHHKVDDIGKFILNKIPQLPSTRSRRYFIEQDTLEDQDISTKSDETWFKKHFYLFIDKEPPKKFHNSQTVSLKSDPTNVSPIQSHNSIAASTRKMPLVRNSLPKNKRAVDIKNTNKLTTALPLRTPQDDFDYTAKSSPSQKKSSTSKPYLNKNKMVMTLSNYDDNMTTKLTADTESTTHFSVKYPPFHKATTNKIKKELEQLDSKLLYSGKSNILEPNSVKNTELEENNYDDQENPEYYSDKYNYNPYKNYESQTTSYEDMKPHNDELSSLQTVKDSYSSKNSIHSSTSNVSDSKIENNSWNPNIADKVTSFYTKRNEPFNRESYTAYKENNYTDENYVDPTIYAYNDIVIHSCHIRRLETIVLHSILCAITSLSIKGIIYVIGPVRKDCVTVRTFYSIQVERQKTKNLLPRLNPAISNTPKKFLLHTNYQAPKKPVTQMNKAPHQYFATPVPMTMKEFERFLKENNLDVPSLTAPLSDHIMPKIQFVPKKKTQKTLVQSMGNDNDKIRNDKKNILPQTNKVKGHKVTNKKHKSKEPVTERSIDNIFQRKIYLGNGWQSKNEDAEKDILKHKAMLNGVKKREVTDSERFTAKDVAALEIILDLQKNYNQSFVTIPDSIYNLSKATEVATTEQSNISTNAIQVHISLLENLNDRKRSLQTHVKKKSRN